MLRNRRATAAQPQLPASASISAAAPAPCSLSLCHPPAVCHYVYVPAGGGPAALVLTLALSAALHGGSRAWLVWGGLQALALLVERGLAHRPLPGAASLHPCLRAALAQCATLTTLLVQASGGGSRRAACGWLLFRQRCLSCPPSPLPLAPRRSCPWAPACRRSSSASTP